MKPKYTKVTEDTYEVRVDGIYKGDVFKWWSRVGGAGWCCTGKMPILFKTRKEATRILLKGNV